jgi:hypothetical protein
MKYLLRFLDNVFSIVIYTLIFVVFLGYAEPDMSCRQVVGYSLILGFFAGSINNIERVLRELFDKK